MLSFETADGTPQTKLQNSGISNTKRLDRKTHQTTSRSVVFMGPGRILEGCLSRPTQDEPCNCKLSSSRRRLYPMRAKHSECFAALCGRHARILEARHALENCRSSERGTRLPAALSRLHAYSGARTSNILLSFG